MNRFQEHETTTLIELLGQHTLQLTAMLVKTVNSKEYEDCKNQIEELQAEIASRTKSSHSTTFTPSEVSFNQTTTRR